MHKFDHLLRALLTVALLSPWTADRARAQSDTGPGMLEGTVSSEGSGVPVEGVLVTAVSADSRRFARTARDGAFELELAAGSYEVNFSHPQFAGRTLSPVVIVAGRAYDAAVILTREAAPPTAGVEEIVVTGSYVERTVDQTRFSESVVDILSSSDFSVTGDSSVVDALSRITGVTIVDDRFVYVRGLGERYSSVLFNGALLPSPDPVRRVIPLDLFPSGVMDQLSIQKTYSAHLPGDFSGGSLQMATRQIPGEREARTKLSLEYNTNVTGKKRPFLEGGDWDWAGFDDGFRRRPGFIDDLSVGGRLPFPGLLSDEDLTTVGQVVNRDYGTTDDVIPPNISLDASYGNSFEGAGGGSIGFLLGGRHSNTWSWDVEERNTTTDGPNGPQFEDLKLEEETRNQIGYSLLGTSEIGFTDTHFLTGTLFYTRRTEKRLIREVGFERENDRNLDETSYEWEERQLWTAQLVGDHLFPHLDSLAGDWGFTFSRATRDAPDSRFIQYDVTPNGGIQFANEAGSNQRRWEELTDIAYDAYANLELPLTVTDDIRTTLKTGAKFYNKERDSRQFTYRYSNRFSNSAFNRIKRGSPGEIFGDENIGPDRWELFEITLPTDSYTAEETLLAAYFETDTELFTDWRLNAGVRWEDSELTSLTGGTNPEPGVIDERYFLPATTLTWSFWRDMQLRAAYSQTLNRPDLREIAEACFFDPETRDKLCGNKNLKIAEITNYDLRWEWYHSGLDNVQIALFYKEIDNPIEQNVLLLGSSSEQFNYENAETAVLYGAELAFRQSLEPIHDVVRDVFVKFNGSIIESEVDIFAENISQTNKKRQLQGQSPWVVNTQVTYDNLPRDIQATLAFSMFGDRLTDIGTRGLDDSFELARPNLDFNYRHGFRLFGQDLRFGLRAKNLLDSAFVIERSGLLEHKAKFGRDFQVSLEASF